LRRAEAIRTIEWLPLIAGAAYVLLVLVRFPTLVRALYWDSDAAGAFVLGQLGHAHSGVEIPRFGWWSSLWWLLATRHLPGHEYLWEATGYVFALATAALVGWATSRIAGSWAGVTAAAVAAAVGPRTLTSLLTVNFHTTTPFTAAVLGAYLVVVTRRRSWLLAAALGVLAGVNVASDPLLLIAGLAPFTLAASVLAVTTRRWDVAARAGAVLATGAICAAATDLTMRALDFRVIPVGLKLATPGDLASNVVEASKSVSIVFGANFLSYPTYPSDPLRYLVAIFAFAALAATLLSALRLVYEQAEPATQAYASFWAVSALSIGLAYCTTNQAAGGGPGGGVNYMLSLAPAAGVGVALLAAGSPRARVVVGLAVAGIAVVNMVGVAQGRAEEHVSAQGRGPAVIRLLERERLTRGYGPFWDAQSLTWKSGMRVLVTPVQACAPRAGSPLCRHHFFTIDTWYDEQPGRSFLIVDPAAGLWERPPPTLGRAVQVHRLGRDVTVYVYRHDIAGQIRP
jgi:hypothetical protein